MKLAILIVGLLVCGAQAAPFVEQPSDFIENPRWTLSADGANNMHIIDLNPAVIDTEPLFNPAQDIFYLLFTRLNPMVPQRITSDPDALERSHFIRLGSTRFLIHGWQSSSNSGENSFIRDELLERGNHNVIVVDWSVGAGTANYVSARNRVGPAGAEIARFIDRLHDSNFVRHNQVNIIGHSLGAHVAGFVGKNSQSGRINAIFGTDPAGPLFSVDSPNARLASGDATYTEAIHTNGGTLGISEPITHASFYPNWGSSQPGCGIDVAGSCAHGRSTRLYSESVNSNAFRGRQCVGHADIVIRQCPGSGTGIMGGDAVKSIRGVFFLETNSAAPFARG